MSKTWTAKWKVGDRCSVLTSRGWTFGEVSRVHRKRVCVLAEGEVETAWEEDEIDVISSTSRDAHADRVADRVALAGGDEKAVEKAHGDAKAPERGSRQEQLDEALTDVARYKVPRPRGRPQGEATRAGGGGGALPALHEQDR
jgi:hypothetical protein